MTTDADTFYEQVVESAYTDAVVHARNADLEADASPANETPTLGDVPDRLNPWADDDADLEEYGSGVQGDRSRDEYLKREEQVDILAEALERGNVADGDLDEE